MATLSLDRVALEEVEVQVLTDELAAPGTHCGEKQGCAVPIMEKELAALVVDLLIRQT
ncbi:hypothetical protein [Rhodococcus sp. UNC363MFTsu5.1]|uniref:hypothetical protein n=1 Tax=Rhodococcus sp. UNC363MFTsu5.1 TaxID=1449069 RepID=UPI0012DC1F40|nr:hypothetical protein [Rhodococcus sp. UNC363MFTsu5.1]